MLRRADWKCDLHFQTQTTIDTLDYSGDSINAGSKLVVAAAGPARFELMDVLPDSLSDLPEGFDRARVVMPGVVALRGPKLPEPSFDYDDARRGEKSGEQVESEGLAQAHSAAPADIERLCRSLPVDHPLCRFRMIVVVDDPEFVSRPCGSESTGKLNNWLWTTFTRANPAADVWGVKPFTRQKHWGCLGPLVIDARVKPHHAPILEEDPQVTEKIEAMATGGGPLAGLW